MNLSASRCFCFSTYFFGVDQSDEQIYIQATRERQRERATVTAEAEVSDRRQGDTAGNQTVATNVAENMRHNEAAVVLHDVLVYMLK